MSTLPEPPSRLTPIFQPRSVALVGGSRDATSMGGTLLRNLVSSFHGHLYLVHPHVPEIAGLRTWPSLREAPAEIDLAIIAVPAAQVLATVEQCLEKPVRGLVVISAGFGETGAAGRELEEAVLARTRQAGIPLVGPNCLGVLNNDPVAPLNATFSLESPAVGDVAVCTQSGALGFVFPDFMRHWGLGVAQLISLGNKSDVGENDVLDFWADAPQVRVVQLYLESFQDPTRFVIAARHLARRRPLVTLLGGQTSAGHRAAGSHTAALASPIALARAAVRQAGGILVDTLSELFAVTAQLALQPLPAGPRVAVLTNAGGPGVLCADALESQGLTVPALSPELQTQLRRHVPAPAAVTNPVDLIGTTDPAQYAACLRWLLDSNEIDQVVVIYVPRLAGTSGAVARAVVDTAASASRKTLAAVFMESSGRPSELQDVRLRIPAFDFPEMAACALAHATRYGQWRRTHDGARFDESSESRRNAEPPRRALEVATANLASCVARTAPHEVADGWLPPAAVQQWLADAGLHSPAWGLATATDEALVVAERIGWPVAVKLVSRQVLHKSRAGGVVLDVRNAEELRRAWDQVRSADPAASAVLLQSFVRGGREVFVGLQRVPRFGLVLACGRGGVDVERWGGVGFRLWPCAESDLWQLLKETGLDDWLSADSAASSALVELIRRVAGVAARQVALVEADFNPVSFRGGESPQVLDARLRFSTPAAS
ncbi:MAG: acetate--CoA ligase family protein [Pirellulales bacterium]